jgi:hypothetical protein
VPNSFVTLVLHSSFVVVSWASHPYTVLLSGAAALGIVPWTHLVKPLVVLLLWTLFLFFFGIFYLFICTPLRGVGWVGLDSFGLSADSQLPGGGRLHCNGSSPIFFVWALQNAKSMAWLTIRGWSCKSCTYTNRSFALYCTVCGYLA